jgi:tRNA1(Val) A37 N6-methylase TrmN6
MAEASTELGSAATAEELTEDLWLGGRLKLVQPKRGHRVGTDAALLVAAAGDAGQGRIVDVGAGVGAVGLALAQRSAHASVDLVEIDLELAQLAESNGARNGLQARTRVLRLDALNPKDRRAAGLADGSAVCVVTNPPFLDAAAVRASPHEAKARAHVMPRAGLADWIEASLAMLAPGGRFVMIHRPDALAMILATIRTRLGAVALLPVHPAIGASAHRLLVSGVKGPKAPLRVAPGLVLHGADGRLTAKADALHRGEALIDWGR